MLARAGRDQRSWLALRPCSNWPRPPDWPRDWGCSAPRPSPWRSTTFWIGTCTGAPGTTPLERQCMSIACSSTTQLTPEVLPIYSRPVGPILADMSHPPFLRACFFDSRSNPGDVVDLGLSNVEFVLSGSVLLFLNIFLDERQSSQEVTERLCVRNLTLVAQRLRRTLRETRSVQTRRLTKTDTRRHLRNSNDRRDS